MTKDKRFERFPPPKEKVKSDEISNSTIVSDHILNETITADKIVPGTISTTQLADGAVTSEKIAPGAVSIASLEDGSVTSTKLADNSVTSSKILDNNVTSSKIANVSVTNAKLADGSVTNSKIENNAVTGSKIAATGLVNPIAHGYHLSASRSAGWVRIAHLNNMGGVEFWTRATVSGNHSITKWIFTYTYFENNPCISVRMSCNSSYGTPWNNIRVVYKSTYDRVYLELNIAIALSFQVSQVSAFGSYVSGISNITLENGGIPSGYTSVAFGNYVNNSNATLSI